MPNIDLPIDKISHLIDEISFGGKIVRIKNAKEADVLVYFKHCTGYDKMMASIVYEVEYDRAIADGFMTIQQATDILTERGIFTGKEEEEIEILRGKIKAQEKVLEMITKVPSRKDRVKEIIDGLSEQIFEIIIKKETKLDFCAEKRAQEAKFNHLLYRGIYRPGTDNLWWPTKEHFEAETDIIFKNRLYTKYIKFSLGLDVSLLRYIARHSLWRVRYTAALKLSDSLFNRSILDYTVDQQALVYWSSFYQSIYEMLPSDRPGDSIIEDDASLDAFMKNYFEEKSREAVGDRGTKGGGLTAWNHNETIVTRANPARKDLEYTKTKVANINKTGTDVTVKK